MPITIVYDNTAYWTGSGKCCAWTVPTGVCSATFEIWGGGGGGYNYYACCSCCGRTSSGGGGGYAMKTVSVTPGDVYTLCAGCAGASTDGTCNGAGSTATGCNGGTSFVTGAAFATTTFCATGGIGGCLTYGDPAAAYGCIQTNSGGCGVGGDVNQSGQPGFIASSGTGLFSAYTKAGDAGGPGGGAGGFNGGCDPIYGGLMCNGTNPNMNGQLPGGGGAGIGTAICCTCYSLGSGRGAPGMVKVTW